MFSLKIKVAILSMVIAVAASNLDTCTRRGSIRLQGGQNSSHGRVELCLNRHWRALCANHWEDADAQVACRELGFLATGAVAVSSGFVNTNVGRWMYNIKCYGGENRVFDCPWETVESCGPTCDAGVRCTEGFQPRAFQETMAPRRHVKSNFSANKQEEPTTPPHSLNEIELIGTNRNITLFVAAPNLTVIGTFTNATVKKGIWGLYTQPNYMGTRFMADPRPAASSQAEAAITQDALQSVKPLTGEIILYANRDYTGKSLVFTESTRNLSVYNFNDMASSAQVISGEWKLFKDFDYKSTYYTTSGNPESFPSIPEALKSALSSMKFMPKA